MDRQEVPDDSPDDPDDPSPATSEARRLSSADEPPVKRAKLGVSIIIFWFVGPGQLVLISPLNSYIICTYNCGGSQCFTFWYIGSALPNFQLILDSSGFKNLSPKSMIEIKRIGKWAEWNCGENTERKEVYSGKTAEDIKWSLSRRISTRTSKNWDP